MAEVLCWFGPAGVWGDRPARFWRWVDDLAGPVGTAVRAGWTIRPAQDPSPDGTTVYQVHGDDSGKLVVGSESAVRTAAVRAGGPTSAAGAGRRPGPPVTPANLRPAHRAILVTLRGAGKPLMGKNLASASGYKPGTLRRHTKPLQDAKLIRRTSNGYELTPAGVSLIDAVTGHTPVT